MTGTPDIGRGGGHPSLATLRFLRGTGHLCLVGTLTLFVVLGIFDQAGGAPYKEVWQLVLAHFMGGRALNASLGLTMGFSHIFLLFQGCMQDFILMFYLYPWFVTGYRHVSHWPVIGNTLTSTRELALRHKDRVAPYGAMGLMVFVIFPFWSTGPLVGVVVGYMLGMSVPLTFATVMFGDIVAVAAWIWAYNRLKEYNPAWALVALVAIFAFAVVGTVFARVRWKRKRAAGGSGDDDAAVVPLATKAGPAAASSEAVASEADTPKTPQDVPEDARADQSETPGADVDPGRPLARPDSDDPQPEADR